METKNHKFTELDHQARNAYFSNMFNHPKERIDLYISAYMQGFELAVQQMSDIINNDSCLKLRMESMKQWIDERIKKEDEKE